jgi:hypothetical protein
MCFVRGLKFDSVVDKTMHTVLSSKAYDGWRVVVWMLADFGEVGKTMKLDLTISSRRRRRGSNSLVAVLSAIYSLLVVNKAISVLSLLLQVTG